MTERLVAALQARHINAYLDRKDIAPGEAWRDRISQLIAASDTVVFVLSPDSASSEVCRWEVEQAYELGKRLLPLVASDVPSQSVPEKLAAQNYILCRSDEEFTRAIVELATSIAQDIRLVREQTRLAQLAQNWKSKGESKSNLLRAEALVAAEHHVGVARQYGINTGPLLDVFIANSRHEFETEEIARRKLVVNAFRAQSDYLATRSASVLERGDPVTALYLAIESAPDHRSRFEEHKVRPLTARSGSALLKASRYLTGMHFLEPQQRDYNSLYASPDGAHFCGIKLAELTLIAGSRPFNILASRHFATEIRDLSFSGDSKRVVVLLDDRRTEVLNLTDLRSLHVSGPWMDATYVALNWSGTALHVEGDSCLRGWSLDLCRQFSLFSSQRSETTNDNRMLISALRHGSTMVPGQRSAVTTIGKGGTRCLGWSTASDRWVAHEDNRLGLRSFVVDELFAEVMLAPGYKPVNAIFSSDGRFAAIATCREGGCMWLILSPDGHLLTSIETAQSVEPANSLVQGVLTADGSELITVAGMILSRWQTATGKLLRTERLPARLTPWSMRPELVLSTSADGHFVGVLLECTEEGRSHEVVIFALKSDEEHVAHAFSEFSGEGAYGLIWSPDGKWFVAFGHSSHVVVQAAGDPRIKHRVKHKYDRIDDGVRCAAFDPSQATVLTGSCDCTARRWDLHSGVLIAQYEHPSGVKRVAFSPDGVFVITLDDERVLRVFAAEGGEALHELRLAHETTDLCVGSTGDVFVRERTGRLLVLSRLLNIKRIFDHCCSVLPRGLSSAERAQLDLPPELPDWVVRHRKWPSLLGESTNDVNGIGELVNMLHSVTVHPARSLFRDIIRIYARCDVDDLATMALFVWDHFVSAISELSESYNLSHIRNSDFELAAELFDTLVDIAEEYRSPELPLAMVAAYRGPSGGRFEKWR